MRKLLLNIILLIHLFLFTNKATAKIVLPNVFGNNMVLQQKSDVAFWGQSESSALVKVKTSWDQKNYKTHADKMGNWKLLLKTPKAGGPYQIEITDSSSVILSNVMIGEVWFCSGQSNMEMPMKGFKNQPVANSSEMLAEAGNFNLRLFETKRKASKSPQYEIGGEWKVSDSTSANDFSAVAYIYGSMIQKKLKVPVGIIVSSVGGTRIQSWMDYQNLMSMPDSIKYLNDYNKIDTATEKHKCATALYNGMIAPFVGFGIKGFLWYQGESNRHEPKVYESLFPAMVSSWRKAWNLKSVLPFYYVQIAPFESKDSSKSVKGLREAQLKSLKVIPNAAMAVTMDIGDETHIHPPFKKEVAERLVYCALANTYGFKEVYFSGPVYKSMSISKDKIELSFDYADKGLTTFGKELINFEIADSTEKFYPANAQIKSEHIIEVWSDQVSKPIAVRYAYKEYAKGELYNGAGLPASSFRTDNW